MTNRNSISRIAVFLAVAALAAGVWFWWGRSHSPYKGGIVVRVPKPVVSKDPLQSAASAYNKGKYKDAEKAAERIIEKAAGSKDVKLRKDAARARYIMAYAAARQNNMKEARERFAVLRTEASKLPDKGLSRRDTG